MSVYVCVPSARPVEEVREWAKAWRERGYKVALWRDDDNADSANLAGYWDLITGGCEHNMHAYPGYAWATNAIIKLVLREHPEVDWVVCGGDDVFPDPNHSAEEIARQCTQYYLDMFNEEAKHSQGWSRDERMRIHGIREEQKTFGVMQPTGDRDFGDAQGPYIDRVAGSPWLGREFCKRINQGRGPFWPEYFHMGCDEELQAVATRLGVFWQRPDLTHHHQHWGRPKPGERMGHAKDMPAFLARANSGEEWDKYKKLFAARQAAGFPGSEPL